VVVTLLAVLELVRLQRARAQQRELFGEIVIERVSGEASGREA
jgi:chromatin segregation and condensation protein Rec8/ScpA/Scc1 (kleisin family)